MSSWTGAEVAEEGEPLAPVRLGAVRVEDDAISGKGELFSLHAESTRLRCR